MSFHSFGRWKRPLFGAAPHGLPVRRRSPWTSDAIRRMRELATIGATVSDIASALGRSESAIRNKATLHGISLSR